MDCVHNGFGEHNCYHWEDAGIVCPPNSKLFKKVMNYEMLSLTLNFHFIF